MQRELIAEAPIENRCRGLRLDGSGLPYCANCVTGDPVSLEARNVCDTASLQLWCLYPERHSVCIKYKPQ
jgi:hypothetical protein